MPFPVYFLAEACSCSSTTRESSCAQHCATSKRSCWKARTCGSGQARPHVSEQVGGVPFCLPACLPAWRAAHRAVVEAERGTVRVEHLVQLALRDAQLTLTRLEGLCAREQLGLRL